MAQTSTRIIILIDRYLPILGGAQNNVHQVGHGLAGEGLQITVLTRIVFPGLQREEAIDGIEVIRFGKSRNRLLSKLYCIVAIVRYLIKHKDDYDAVLCVPCIKLTDLLPAYLASRVTRKPYVIRTTSLSLYEDLLRTDLKSFPDALRKLVFPTFLWRKVLTAASTIVNQSPTILDRGRQYGFDSKLVIPNGVDTTKFHSLDRTETLAKRRDLAIPEDKMVVTNTGRYVDVKNQISLLRVARELISEGNKEIFVLLLGATEEGQVADTRDQLVEFVLSNELSEHVRFVDDTNSVADYLQVSDIFVFPTLHIEGMSNSLLEAMATGLPVISSGMDQITCMFPENYPYFYDPKSDRELKDKISEFLMSEKKRVEAGRMVEDHVSEHYALTTTIARYKSLLLGL